jgi:RimJ/RimL family protein N-acetyltransferase
MPAPADIRWRFGSTWYVTRRFPRRAALVVGVWTAAAFIFLSIGGIRVSPACLRVAVAMLLGIGVLVWTYSRSMMKYRGSIVRRLPPVDTERLHLRPPRAADAGAIEGMIDDEIASINGWTDEMRTGQPLSARQSAVFQPDSWVLVDRSSGEPVGMMTVSNRDEPDASTCQVGWWIKQAFRGRGLATEALVGVIALLHQNGFERVRIGTAVDNAPVRRVADKVGAVLEETRPHELPNGTVVDSAWYVHDDG